MAMYAHLARAFEDGSTIQDGLGHALTIRTLPIGDLIVVSGALIACDPITSGGAATPFSTAIPIGTYPVLLSVATHANGAQSVACAMVRFAEGSVERWKMATSNEQDIGDLEPDEFFGYAVDSGKGCFMDGALGLVLPPEGADSPLYAAIVDEDEARMDAIFEHMDGKDPSWANVVVDSTTGANIVAFESGYGDGVYASFFGYDAQGRLVCLVTDFEVLPS